MRCRPAEGVLCAVLIMWLCRVQLTIPHSLAAVCCQTTVEKWHVSPPVRHLPAERFQLPLLLPSEKLQTLAKHVLRLQASFSLSRKGRRPVWIVT